MTSRGQPYPHQRPQPQAGESGARACLKCRGSFLSEGPHNRICKPCKAGQAWREGLALAEFNGAEGLSRTRPRPGAL